MDNTVRFCWYGRKTRVLQDDEWVMACGCVIEFPLTADLISHGLERHGISEAQLRGLKGKPVPRTPKPPPDDLKLVETWGRDGQRVPRAYHTEWRWWERAWADFFMETPPWRRAKAD